MASQNEIEFNKAESPASVSNLDYVSIMQDIVSSRDSDSKTKAYGEKFDGLLRKDQDALLEQFFKQNIQMFDLDRDSAVSMYELGSARLNSEKLGLNKFEEKLLAHAAVNFPTLDGYESPRGWQHSNLTNGAISLDDFANNAEAKRQDALAAKYAVPRRELAVYDYVFGSGRNVLNELDTNINGRVEKIEVDDELKATLRAVRTYDPSFLAPAADERDRYGYATNDSVYSMARANELRLKYEALQNLSTNSQLISNSNDDGAGMTEKDIDAYIQNQRAQAFPPS